MSLDQTPEWELGEVAVRHVREWLRGQGFYLLPTDRIEMGGAPRFIGPSGAITVPDLLAASHGQTRWVEVKWKTSCVLHQRTRTWRHGVDLDNWKHYVRVQNLTSIQGWLAIVQLRPGPEVEPQPALLLAPFDLLSHHLQRHDGAGGSRAWWDVDVFDQFPITLGDDWRSIHVGPRVVRPWERAGRNGVAPQWRPTPAVPSPPPSLFDDVYKAAP